VEPRPQVALRQLFEAAVVRLSRCSQRRALRMTTQGISESWRHNTGHSLSPEVQLRGRKTVTQLMTVIRPLLASLLLSG